MSENTPLVGEDPTQLPESTAASEQLNETPENVENQADAEPEKKFTQAEIDAMISKRLAREQRKWEREQARITEASRAPVSDPKPDQFETQDAYIAALAEKRAFDLIKEKSEKEVYEATRAKFEEKADAAREKYSDFDKVALGRHFVVTEQMRDALFHSPAGPDVAYYLGSNPDESFRIASLPPAAQAEEIGRLGAKVLASPPVKKTSAAPAPLTPLNSSRTGKTAIDTTDPRSIAEMDTSAWIAAENRRVAAKLRGG